MTVTGPNIPAGTTIAAIGGLTATAVTLSQAATTATSGKFTFTGADLSVVTKAAAYVGQSEGFAQLNGLRMAEAVEEALSPGFFSGQGLIHLMGHSHGSKVATVAALTLQQQGVPVAQLTLFESPESGPSLFGQNTYVAGLGGGENFLWYYLSQMNISTTPVELSSGVEGITVTDAGSGYGTTPPSVTISGGGGTGAMATANLTNEAP